MLSSAVSLASTPLNLSLLSVALSICRAQIKLLATLRRYTGPSLRDLLNDIKPALLTTIDAGE